jgi:hypothetical protein
MCKKDEPSGRNPGKRQASRVNALIARLIDQATRVADFIKASGLTPRSKAGL